MKYFTFPIDINIVQLLNINICHQSLIQRCVFHMKLINKFINQILCKPCSGDPGTSIQKIIIGRCKRGLFPWSVELIVINRAGKFTQIKSATKKSTWEFIEFIFNFIGSAQKNYIKRINYDHNFLLRQIFNIVADRNEFFPVSYPFFIPSQNDRLDTVTFAGLYK